MYTMYAEKKHWKLEILNENETGLGGYKEISFMITGKGVYSRLKFESGVHRVQRVPDTESSGRIHTSTATVAVLTSSRRCRNRNKSSRYKNGSFPIIRSWRTTYKQNLISRKT